jgi:hypothetical protein
MTFSLAEIQEMANTKSMGDETEIWLMNRSSDNFIRCSGPDNVIGGWSNFRLFKDGIKDKNNYLRLEAFAATFGKYVHPDGSVSKAREDALYREQVPNEVSGDGRDMVIYGYSSSISTKEVDAMFMELQNKQREFEKQLNAIKHQANEEANKRTSAAMQKYKEEYEKYSQAVSKIRTDMNLYITNGREEIANMKIVIPEKLQDTYEYLEALGKNK